MYNDTDFLIFEGMTSISALIQARELKGESAREIYKVIYVKENEKKKFRQISFLRAKSKELGFLLESADAEIVDSLAAGNTHGGFIALCSERSYPEVSEDLINKNGIYYLIEGIEDPYNFGYILRSLYAAGADGVVLSKRNWMSAAGVVSKSSAGCSELINIFNDDPESAVKLFKSLGFRILSANIRDSVGLYSADLSAPLLFIIGGEKRGISRSLLDLSDQNVRISYGRNFSGSLPSSQAAAIISFEVAKYNERIK